METVTLYREIDSNTSACSIIDEPFGIQIGNTVFNCTKVEGVSLSQGYNFIEKIRINNNEYFLYYIEHASKNDVLGWSICYCSYH